jgi:hypothetical protein
MQRLKPLSSAAVSARSRAARAFARTCGRDRTRVLEQLEPFVGHRPAVGAAAVGVGAALDPAVVFEPPRAEFMVWADTIARVPASRR